jgi:long-chain fatty acid transport protein
MVFVGERMDAGIQLFMPTPRGYTVTGSQNPNMNINAEIGKTYESDKDWFLIPSFAYNWQLNSDSTAGVTVYGNGGMNTDYPASNTPGGAGTFGQPNVFNAGDAGISLAQLFVNLSYAKKINAKHAFGGSLIVAWQRFEGKGLDAFGQSSVDPANLSGNRKSDSFGAGLKFGYQGEVSEGVRVGASYQSKISMSEFDEYKGLFAEAGDFDIPSTYNVGISVDIGKTGVIVADIQQINYSDVDSIANPIAPNLFPPAFGGTCTSSPTGGTGTGCLGGSNGAGFGWEDMTVFKIGYQFEVGGNTYRVGYSHADQPIPDSETLFNVLAPAVIEDHFTAGLTMPMKNNQEFNLAVMYAPNNSVKGANPFDGGATQIEIEMSQWDIQAGWAWKY